MSARPSPSAADSRPAQDHHRVVVEDLTETICRIRPDGTFTYVNEVFCRFFGKKQEELLGQCWHPVAVAEDLPMIEDKLRLITPQNPVVVIENRVHNAQGTACWMQFVNRGLFDDAGSLVEMQSVGRDITERVLAEAKLRENQQRWRFALESSGFGMWDWDITTNQTFFSRQWKAMLGYEDELEVANTFDGWQRLIHPDDVKIVEKAIEGHLKGWKKDYAVEFRMRCKDSTWKWVRSRGQVIERDENGKPVRMTGTHVDISKRKEAEEREASSLKLVAEGAPASAVLEAIVLNVEATYPGMRCSVMLVDGTGLRLKIKTAPRLPEFVRKAIDDMEIGPGAACCGAAAYSASRTICHDVLQDPRMEAFHKLAAKAKLRACWSEPIVSSQGTVLGTLACYRQEVHHPSPSEILNVSNAARLAAVAIEREWKEQALLISEQRYARALRGTTDGLWDWNILTGDVYLSPRWKLMLGYEENDLADGRDDFFMARLHPDDVLKVQAARQAHFEHATPYQVEFRLRTKSGSFKWLLARGQAEWNENGVAVRMTGTISDISSRKVAERALEASERRFRTIFEQAAVGIAVIDTSSGRFVSVNQRMCEINRRSREDMLRLTFMDVTYADDLQEDIDRMEDLKAGRIGSFNMEKRNIAPDGSLTWVNLTVAPMWVPGEPPLRHIAVAEDITTRKEAEKNYLRELAYNQALVDHTAALIVVMNVEGRFVRGNAAFFSSMGYMEDEVIGRTPWEVGLMDPKGIARSKERFGRLLRGEDNPATDVRLRTKSGEWRTVELRSTSTRNPDGTPDRIVITGTDVTERNRLQREVLRVIEQEQARVGHDLHDGVGQTMTGILVLLDALEADVTGGTREQVVRIHELMMQSVAEVRRMSHGLSPTSVKYRGITGALQLLAETVRTNFRTPCECHIDNGIALGSEEKEGHLFRIAQEAVNNALRHGKPTLVKLSLRRIRPDECELRVEDNGRGLKKKKNGRIGAHGIGMQVMDYRANLIGGRLKIENLPRRGVVITCHIECEPEKKRKAPTGKKTAGKTPKRKKSS
ncbi:MAG: PAS domain S-box protein [Prosthecobacter sp.]|jgi:PAS domain S-box-containing protein|uniref:PAS domain S-box protein n=1 Tax=Prosthecobacter sp. TaxID=1965333 RepID=UPI0019E7869D|nr:PAS domain S-box protein [Prosthecobacter sp.]MBE2285934.1 PAS domain S-box protein [Prosthecobacter sp.]